MPVYQLDTTDYWFPPVSEALTNPAGLLAIGGDLCVPRLLHAYQQGIFPWFSDQEPILWWAPSPRMVLKPEHIHVSKSMRKWMRKTQFSVTFDYAFERVVDACGSTVRAGQVQAESWITPAIKEAYTNLFRSGYAHSVEVWRGSELVGGLYGVALGRMFFGESMFSLADNGSKLAFIHLAQQLQAWGFVLIDCQMHTHHLSSLGAAEIEMAEFQAYLDHNLTFGVDSCWELVLE
ncbi:MAG: leucyl/phenylalanyl-tRNA--protein transferase [Oceanospirillaceae bacterium]|jgi:leucyl/phenylalanyl-tRNA--protein transferase|nr:leucyl/phenylalanyl-tRNA--protein transferase [Oceanospirillaceae bacterium]MBT4443705.1 leucyl/phenylalanyl-tRNA--protein transferase [Oceanospirillaceae bacterium]MBT6077796.1 leucyl/phenylalanyl-tRNA--protein transferase [Oceanospirillaceae bacterium]MBT7329974.1 leucyl/phenylalanyl-tRNA--protein transferase [Oceanospirillaceae bacterium]